MKTAVEWLEDQIKWRTNINDIIIQAKEIEKEQAKTMYSEEDLREAFHVGRLYQGREGDINFEKWYEQKNK